MTDGNLTPPLFSFFPPHPCLVLTEVAHLFIRCGNRSAPCPPDLICPSFSFGLRAVTRASLFFRDITPSLFPARIRFRSHATPPHTTALMPRGFLGPKFGGLPPPSCSEILISSYHQAFSHSAPPSFPPLLSSCRVPGPFTRTPPGSPVRSSPGNMAPI